MLVIGCLIALALATPVSASPLTAEEFAPVLPFSEAGDYVGEICFVFGEVVLTKNIGSRCFLNFHQDYRNHFTVVINRHSFGNFPEPPEEMYLNKRVKVLGRVIEYAGTPEIIVDHPEQITILTGDYPNPKPRRAPRPKSFDGSVRIATYNVLNLFDGVDDPYRDDETTPTKPRDVLDKLAATVRKIDADVLALQEVENRFYLDRFADALLMDMGYREVVLLEGNNWRGIDVALLSRFPVGPVTSYRHATFPDANGKAMRFQRDLLRVRIEPPGVAPFDVFVVHLKSKGGGEEASLSIRLVEARQIRRIADAALADEPGAPFVICGDFNDTIDSKPLRTILGEGPTGLKHMTDDLSPDHQVSYNKPPYRSMIDFILCSPAMARAYREDSYRILQCSVDACGSDHNPVVADFDLRRPTPAKDKETETGVEAESDATRQQE